MLLKMPQNAPENVKKTFQRNFHQWYFVNKIDLTYCEKNCFSDQEKLLKFEAEG